MLILLYIHFILNGRSTSIILHVVFGNIYVHINAIPNHFKCSNISTTVPFSWQHSTATPEFTLLHMC